MAATPVVAVVVRGSVPHENYREQTKQRLLNDHGNISLTPEQLDWIIKDLSQFAKSVSAQLSDMRKQQAIVPPAATL
jgi:hypothetical protein